MTIENVISSNGIPVAQKSNDTMGKDDFLKLMLIQMQQQDPLNPMDNQAMLAQMAQFSSLEQMSNLNNTLSAGQQFSQLMDTAQLLGREIEFAQEQNDGSTATLKSVVKSIRFTSEGPVLTMENGIQTRPQNIQSITDLTTTN